MTCRSQATGTYPLPRLLVMFIHTKFLGPHIVIVISCLLFFLCFAMPFLIPAIFREVPARPVSHHNQQINLSSRTSRTFSSWVLRAPEVEDPPGAPEVAPVWAIWVIQRSSAGPLIGLGVVGVLGMLYINQMKYRWNKKKFKIENELKTEKNRLKFIFFW